MLSINMDDVMQVLSNCRNYLIAIALFLVLAIIVSAAAKNMEKPKRALVRRGSWIACLIAVVISLNLVCTGPLSTLLTLVSGRGTITEESSAVANDLCVELAEEGIVLLQNDDALLPLSSGAKLNVFGWASISPVYGGTGSGGLSDSIPKTDLLTGLADAGVSVNQELVDFYTEYKPSRPELGYDVHTWDLPEPPAYTYPEELLADAKAYSDTAMIVVSRIGGEFADLLHDMNIIDTNEKESYSDNSDAYEDFPDGTHYLELSQSEQDMVKLVCDNFDNVILVYNSANTLELGFVDDYNQIKSVIWVRAPGRPVLTHLAKSCPVP